MRIKTRYYFLCVWLAYLTFIAVLIFSVLGNHGATVLAKTNRSSQNISTLELKMHGFTTFQNSTGETVMISLKDNVLHANPIDISNINKFSLKNSVVQTTLPVGFDSSPKVDFFVNQKNSFPLFTITGEMFDLNNPGTVFQNTLTYQFNLTDQTFQNLTLSPRNDPIVASQASYIITSFNNTVSLYDANNFHVFNQTPDFTFNLECTFEYYYEKVSSSHIPCRFGNGTLMYYGFSTTGALFDIGIEEPASPKLEKANPIRIGIPSRNLDKEFLFLDQNQGAFFGEKKSKDATKITYEPVTLSLLQSFPSIYENQKVLKYTHPNSDGANLTNYIVYPNAYIIPEPNSHTLLYLNSELLHDLFYKFSQFSFIGDESESRVLYFKFSQFHIYQLTSKTQALASMLFTIHFAWGSVAATILYIFYKLVPTLQNAYQSVCETSLGNKESYPRNLSEKMKKTMTIQFILKSVFFFQSISFLFEDRLVDWKYVDVILGIPSSLSTLNIFNVKEYFKKPSAPDSSVSVSEDNSNPVDSLSYTINTVWLILVVLFIPVLYRYAVLFFTGTHGSIVPLLAKQYVKVLKKNKPTTTETSGSDSFDVDAASDSQIAEHLNSLYGFDVNERSPDNPQALDDLHAVDSTHIIVEDEHLSDENEESIPGGQKTHSDIEMSENIPGNSDAKNIESPSIPPEELTESLTEEPETHTGADEKSATLDQIKRFQKSYVVALRALLLLVTFVALILITATFEDPAFAWYFYTLFGFFFSLHYLLTIYLALKIKYAKPTSWAADLEASTILTPFPIIIFTLALTLSLLITSQTPQFQKSSNESPQYIVANRGVVVTAYILYSVIVLCFLPTFIANVKLVIFSGRKSEKLQFELLDPRLSRVFTLSFLPFLKVLASITACTTVDNVLTNPDSLAVHPRNGLFPDAPQQCFSNLVYTTIGFLILYFIIPALTFFQIIIPLYSIPSDPIFIGPLQNSSQVMLFFFLTLFNNVIFPSNVEGKLIGMTLTFGVHFFSSFTRRYSSVYLLNIIDKAVVSLIFYCYCCSLITRFGNAIAGSILLILGFFIIPGFCFYWYRRQKHLYYENPEWVVEPFFRFQKNLLENGIYHFFLKHDASLRNM